MGDMSLLRLPDELLLQIAAQLDFHQLFSLQEVCARLCDVIRSDAALQYAIELRVAGMIDNPASHLVPGERFRILRAKENAWRAFDLSDKVSLPLRHQPSGIYDLTGGTFLLGERRFSDQSSTTDAVNLIRLHSVFPEGPEHAERDPSTYWSKIDLKKQVIDVGLAVQEHDLIAVVTYSYVNEARLLASIDIHLLKHSTGQPHPAAAKPVLHVGIIHYFPGHCSIMLEISGDTLCFLLNNYFPFINADPVAFTIYNWKTGHAKVGQRRLCTDPTMFNSFVLLSPETVAIPIVPFNSLEICQFTEEFASPAVPESEDEVAEEPEVPTLKTSCILELPPLDRGATVLRMTCRCEPNPRGPSSSATHIDASIPYHSDPGRAIMILHLHLRLAIGTTRVYTMIVHRASLLQAMRIALARKEDPETPTAASPECLDQFVNLDGDDDMNDFLDDEVGQPIPGAYHHFVAYEGAAPRQQRSGWHSGASQSGQEDVKTREPVRVPWAEWGPAVTRWFQDELAGPRWITTTCGQRFVRVRDDGRLRVYDFNQLAIRRFTNERSLAGQPFGALPGEVVLERQYWEWSRELDADEGAEGEDLGVERIDMDEVPYEEGVRGDQPSGALLKPSRRVKVVLGTTKIADPASWQMNLESSLPYMETSVPTPGDYESVLVDEDIILGLEMDNDARHISKVVLHRIGGPAA
ncbi:hypothetical protein C8Q78DRAFT_1184113 [Trametes maxima]|nr:hypothetical protein C8Q78DRAFT_1184113 [Trametes maxima]